MRDLARARGLARVLGLAALGGLLAAGAPAAAQVVQDGQFWLNATVFATRDDLTAFAEVQPRFGDGISRLDQILVRPAIGWRLSEDLRIYQGYAYVETPLPAGGAQREHRSFQQVDWTLSDAPGGILSVRTRLEQRSLSEGRDLGWRARGMLRYARPLTGDTSGPALLGWVEPFVNLNTTERGARAGLDRVRTFVGLQLPLEGKSTVEVGYINQTVNTPAPGTEVDHILSLNVLMRY